MPRYRIFTNDRGKKRGVPMYSCLESVTAPSAFIAARKVNPAFGVDGGFAPIVAVLWPPEDAEAKQWLAKHVGSN